MTSPDLTVLLSFFKVLADESRLRILGLLATQERSVEELAALLDLKGPTVSHHLAKLKELGLVRVTAQGTTHLHALDPAGLHALSKDLLAPERLSGLVADVEGDAWERKVLKDFLVEGERLKEIPASRKKREVILRWLAERFLPERQYPEKEVNALLTLAHPDFATWRRELVMAKLLARQDGLYWRVPLEDPRAAASLLETP